MAFSTINKSSLYQNTVLYSGNGSTQSITGVGFQPDLTWVKDRGVTHSHRLVDAVRGVTKYIASDSDGAETTGANSLTAFGADGFSVGTDNEYNANTNTYASWNWKANGAGSANTDGSISSTVSANTTSGFSVVKFTTPSSGAFTVGHGLGAVPKVWIQKRLDGIDNWQVYHEGLGNTKKIMLNHPNMQGTSSIWDNTTPTTSLMYIGNGALNASADYIAYCFAEKTGYSKFGSYTGNGNADGTFVYTGFRPAMVILKKTNGTGKWFVQDNKRDGYNATYKSMIANTNGAEDTNSTALSIDYLSNGFKLRNSYSELNGSGDTMIYMAFAEAPFVNSNGVPCNAR